MTSNSILRSMTIKKAKMLNNIGFDRTSEATGFILTLPDYNQVFEKSIATE